MENVHIMLNAMIEELFPDGRQRPLGQSAGGHNDPLSQLQQVNNDNATDDSEFATFEDEATDDTDAAAAEDSAEDSDNADGDGSEPRRRHRSWCC